MNEIASGSIPELACSIVTSCKEFIAIFIKATVGEWKDMSFKFFYQNELLLLFLLDFFY